MHILLVEDDVDLAIALREFFQDHYKIKHAKNARHCLKQLVNTAFDLLIIDLGLPDLNGLDLIKIIRNKKYSQPIVVLTGANAINDKILALGSGADDYVTKPFHYSELSARITALLRRPRVYSDNIISSEDITVNLSTHQVIRSGEIIPLRKKEFELLSLLLRHQGRVLTRSIICNWLWSDVLYEPTSNSLDVHVKHLRDKIDRKFPKKLIVTVPGVGYMIKP
jgi:two-component system OmpR family response regulator